MSKKDTLVKRCIIAKVKEHPIIWDSVAHDPYKGPDSAWREIAKDLNMSQGKVRTMWTSFRKHYAHILKAKTVQRDNIFPRWALFHDLSFIYASTKQSIKARMGGISPPLFESPNPSISDCPCCIPNPQNPIIISDPRTVSDQEQLTDSLQPNSWSKKTRTPYISPKKLQYTSRREIIRAIKYNRVLYAKSYSGPKCPVSTAWKNVSDVTGLPIPTLQNRWRLYKKRYVDELIKERCSNGPFQSNWDSFEEMSFMREYMKASVDDIDRMREEIQTIVTEQKSQSQTIDLCTDDEDTLMGSIDSLSSGPQNNQPDKYTGEELPQVFQSQGVEEPQYYSLCETPTLFQEPSVSNNNTEKSPALDIAAPDLSENYLITEYINFEQNLQPDISDNNKDINGIQENRMLSVVGLIKDGLITENINSFKSTGTQLPDHDPKSYFESDFESIYSTVKKVPTEENISDMKSYQQAFERSITSKSIMKDNEFKEGELPKRQQKDIVPLESDTKKNSDVHVLELDLTSDEEEDDPQIICLDDDESMTSASDLEAYEDIANVQLSYSPVNLPTTSRNDDLTTERSENDFSK